MQLVKAERWKTSAVINWIISYIYPIAVTRFWIVNKIDFLLIIVKINQQQEEEL